MADPAADPLRTMVIDEVIREDGRYLVYYGWPDETDAGATMPEDTTAEPRSAGDDV